MLASPSTAGVSVKPVSTNSQTGITPSTSTTPVRSLSLKNKTVVTNQAPGGTDSNLTNQSNQEWIDPSWDQPVSNEGLKSAWLEYARKVEQENPRLFSILVNHIPVISVGNTVLLKLKHPMQESEILKEKNALFTFLKIKLKNAELSLETEFIKEEDSMGVKAYTSADKLKQMMEKNPALIELKNKFDLDLD